MNRITQLFGIEYPIIQGGMVWCSGWRLASAVSNNGGLGLLGAGSMHCDTLTEHIRKMKEATDRPWGVNVPLLYPEIDKLMGILADEQVKIVFTSALFAQKCEEAGCDAIVAEGFEAGGHNGREETSTLTLIPNVAAHCRLPLIAAGGIASGKAMLAAMILGAEGVQIGSRFAVATESSAHPNFKQQVWKTPEGGTMLALKKIAPTRLIKNEFYEQVKTLEDQGADSDTLKELLGKGRAKQGIFEGNLAEGELEIGQIASMLKGEESVAEIMQDLLRDYNQSINRCSNSVSF